MGLLPRQYRNKVLNSDVMGVLKSLPDESVDLVYADPDYNVGINYAGQKYALAWDEYIDWYSDIISESMRVLKDTGNLFTINYPRQNAHLRVKCLESLAYDLQEYVWVYNTNVGHSKRRFTTAHRSILHATKSKDNAFYKDQVAQPYKNPNDHRIKKQIADGAKGRMPYSWFYFDLVKNVAKDKTFHSCQIPLGLVEMLISATTKPKDNVFILFGGSGSEIVLANKMERGFLSCEINEKYYKMIQDRMSRNGEIIDKYRCIQNTKASRNGYTKQFEDAIQKVLLEKPESREGYKSRRPTKEEIEADFI